MTRTPKTPLLLLCVAALSCVATFSLTPTARGQDAQAVRVTYAYEVVSTDALQAALVERKPSEEEWRYDKRASTATQAAFNGENRLLADYLEQRSSEGWEYVGQFLARKGSLVFRKAK